MLFVEAMALRADGDCKDRQLERGSSRKIDGEHAACRGKVWQVSAEMTVTMTEDQL